MALRLARRTGLLAAAILLLALGFVALAGNLVARTTASRLFARPEEVPARPVAIVLGARVYADGTPAVVLEERLATALRLYQAGQVDRVLVSGDHARPDYDEVNAMHRWLVARGVRTEDVFLDHAGLRTWDTMVRARRIFGVDGAVICTQRFHLPRALYLARAAGLDAVGLVADRGADPHRVWNGLRERLAVTAAVVDVWLEREPRHLGEAVPIEGDARLSHDAATWRPRP